MAEKEKEKDKKGGVFAGLKSKLAIGGKKKNEESGGSKSQTKCTSSPPHPHLHSLIAANN